ncbi:MAG: hypothetical protein ABI151_08695 [Chitinophagaceae bacterium]
MKKIITLCSAFLVLFLLSSCFQKLGGSLNKAQNGLVAYKNSKHHLFVGFLVGDGNDPAASFNPANAPDSVDFLEFFAGRDTTTANWRIAQAKGTRIIACHFPHDAYFDGSIKDPATKIPGYINPAGFDQYHPNASSTYDHWARDTYNQEIVKEALDGIDIDIESGTFGKDVPNTATNGKNLLLAVAKYYGPNCTQCIVGANGKKPVFFYDTDGSAKFEDTMYTAYRNNYDYVLFQSYTTGSHSWRGRGIRGFKPLVDFYGLEKLIFLVNGDSFLYANGKQDRAPQDSIATADLINYATWVKTNNGVGVGAYRMSRDYNHNPPFAISRQAIQIMNPAPRR